MKSHLRYQFRPSLLPTLAAMITVALTFSLGRWQQGRAAAKEGLENVYQQRHEAAPIQITSVPGNEADLQFRRVLVRGVWLQDQQIFLDNKTDGGVAGYHVLTPLRLLDDPTVLLVNRGWIARAPDYPKPPVVPAASGAVMVEGYFTRPNSRFVELSTQTIEGNVWQNLTIERFQQKTPLKVAGWILVATRIHPADAISLRPVEESHGLMATKHVEYMLTWYSLALTTLLLWIGLNLKRVHHASAELKSDNAL